MRWIALWTLHQCVPWSPPSVSFVASSFPVLVNSFSMHFQYCSMLSIMIHMIKVYIKTSLWYIYIYTYTYIYMFIYIYVGGEIWWLDSLSVQRNARWIASYSRRYVNVVVDHTHTHTHTHTHVSFVAAVQCQCCFNNFNTLMCLSMCCNDTSMILRQ